MEEKGKKWRGKERNRENRVEMERKEKKLERRGLHMKDKETSALETHIACSSLTHDIKYQDFPFTFLLVIVLFTRS